MSTGYQHLRSFCCISWWICVMQQNCGYAGPGSITAKTTECKIAGGQLRMEMSTQSKHLVHPILRTAEKNLFLFSKHTYRTHTTGRPADNDWRCVNVNSKGYDTLSVLSHGFKRRRNSIVLYSRTAFPATWSRPLRFIQLGWLSLSL